MNVAGLRKPDRWHGVLAGAALAGLVAAGALSIPATATVKLRAASAAPGAGCGKARGPFHVKGTQVIGRGGKAFIPYGITVAGLFSPPGYSAATRKADFGKIAATASLWCANTVRLQISQAALVGPRPIPGFFRDIENEVSAAEGRHLVVVLNDQTELDPGDPALPTGRRWPSGKSWLTGTAPTPRSSSTCTTSRGSRPRGHAAPRPTGGSGRRGQVPSSACRTW